jgi:hypothetical protein
MARFEEPIHFVGLFLFVALASTVLILLVRADARTRHDHGKAIKIPQESVVIILKRRLQKWFVGSDGDMNIQRSSQQHLESNRTRREVSISRDSSEQQVDDMTSLRSSQQGHQNNMTTGEVNISSSLEGHQLNISTADMSNHISGQQGHQSNNRSNRGQHRG